MGITVDATLEHGAHAKKCAATCTKNAKKWKKWEHNIISVC